MGGDYGKALFYSEKVINNFRLRLVNLSTLTLLVTFNIGGNKRACELLLKSINYGYSQAQTTYDQRCN